MGLTIVEGKALLASLQKQIVTAQTQRYVASIKSCPQCGRAFHSMCYDFIAAHNFAKRRKTLGGLTVYEFI